MHRVSQLLESAKQAYKENDLEKAERFFQEVIELEPENVDAHYIIGLIASAGEKNGRALHHLEKAASLCDTNPNIFFNYGAILQRTAHYGKAAKQYEKTLALKPDHKGALLNYSAVMLILGKAKDAELAARKLHATDPNNVSFYMNLGNSLKDQGLIDEALNTYREFIKRQPENELAGSNMLLCLNYSLNDADTIFREHLEWEKRVKRGITIKTYPRRVLHQDKTPLRIGYISGDFKTHSVAYYFEPILKFHNPDSFEVYCYSDVENPDSMTQRLQRLSHHWHNIHGKKNDEVIELILQDHIDILVDLAGHAGNKRIALFLNRLAPVQVTYLGYPNTTGISTMDYRLTDRWADPEGMDIYYTEKLYRLKDGFLCYRPPVDAPPVSEAPVKSNGYITFGSFNNLPKINSLTIEVWSKILQAVPNAKLFIKSKPFKDPWVQDRYRKLFNEQGIENERLEFSAFAPSVRDHLNTYRKVDIALDTFPYNGTTTTCEALWMGVPVVSLIGEMHAGRVGYSLLSRIGLPSMVAENIEKYIRIAAFLASDTGRLAKLRKGLRTTVAQSPICNGISFVKSLEEAYRDMWREKSISINQNNK